MKAHIKASHLLVLSLFLSICLLTGCRNDSGIKITEGPGKADKFVTPTPVPVDEDALTTLPECKNEKVLILVNSYYEALKNRDIDKLAPLLSDPSLAGSRLIDNYSKVTDLTIKKIYQVQGTDPIETIIYVYYELTIENIIIPSLDELYISSDGAARYIFNGTISHDKLNELLNLSKNEGADKLILAVNKAFRKTVEENPGLREVLGEGGILPEATPVPEEGETEGDDATDEESQAED